jgi:hypothetical protein
LSIWWSLVVVGVVGQAADIEKEEVAAVLVVFVLAQGYL